jgi:PAS domain S-box-containing protein
MPVRFKEAQARARSWVLFESDRSHRLQIAVLVGSLCTFALMWGGIAHHLRISTEAAKHQAHRDVLNLANGVGAEMERLFVGVDQVMSIMADDLAQSPGTFDLATWTKRATLLKSVANQVSLWNEKGELVASLLPVDPKQPKVNVADRTYFQVLASTRRREVYIGPTMTGRLSGDRVIQVAKRLERPDGEFAGVLLVSMLPGNVAERFKEYDVGRHGFVAVTGRDGFVRARYPIDDAIYGIDFRTRGAAAPSEALAEGSTVGTNESPGPLNGERRFVGYKAVRGYPLVVVVGRRYDDVMERYGAERLPVVLVGVATTVAGLIFLFVLLRELELRRKRSAMLGDAHVALETKEAALREGSRLQSTAERLAKVGHWYYDLSTSKLRVSDEAFRIYGVAPADLDFTMEWILGRVHPEDRETFTTWWRRARAEARDTDHEYRILLDDGSTKTIHVRNVFERDDVGNPTAVLGAIMDVTERRSIEADLRASREQTEVALRQAEHASRAKSDFLASMSHELRTPLNAVIGFTGLMIDSGNLRTPEMMRYARTVQDAGRTLLSVVNDVLDVSKLEAGGVELDPRPFDLRQMIGRTADFLRQEATAKGLDFRVELAADLPRTVAGDGVRLRQILLNLLSNAVKFTSSGHVTVSAARVGTGADRIRFAVEDTGVGIPEDKLHRLFVRFSQVDGSTARRFGGTGLGLSICKDLVELMGGEITVSTRPGEGAVFAFEIDLPTVADSSPEAGRTAPAVLPHAEDLSILLAEDVRTNRDLAVALLRSWGHAVDVVADGAAVVAAVHARDYDLVLMDVQMPLMDGLEAARRIRALDGARSQVPIVAMTANVMREDVAASAAAGMDGHVGKPFSPDELRASVDRFARRRPSSAPRRPAWALPKTDVLDVATFETLAGTLGLAPAEGLLAALQVQLDETWNGNPSVPDDWECVRKQAHDLVSAAGLLGFSSLSMASRELASILRADGGGTRRALEALDIARMEQAAVSEFLQARLHTVPSGAA